MLALVLAIVGILMWILARLLRAHQTALSSALIDLQNARESLVREEKLAAVGRLASGIAHEIRNPVAMIASALTTAADSATDVKEREEMFAIAGRQARRLESLTTEFLTYARPSVPRRSPILVADLLSAIASGTRIRATDRHIEVTCRTAQEATVDIDASQVEGALMNLTLNAVEATTESSAIIVVAELENNALNIEVENSGPSIPDSNLARIFEPFFTTKHGGTGLGLAIARGVARAHGGDLWVSRNESGRVAFTMTLGVQVADENEQGEARG